MLEWENLLGVLISHSCWGVSVGKEFEFYCKFDWYLCFSAVLNSTVPT